MNTLVLDTACKDGPCNPWTTPEQVAACCETELDDDTSLLFTESITAASDWLYGASGFAFNGVCETTDYPCRRPCSEDPCSCGAALVDYCSCSRASRVRLNHPIREILSVVIDGEPLTGGLGVDYVVNRRSELIRLSESCGGCGATWPACQYLDEIAGDCPGTWSITYTYGCEPPTLGVQAANKLACLLVGMCIDKGCSVPEGLQTVSRGTARYARTPLSLSGASNKIPFTGIFQIDAFLTRYNPAGLRSNPLVWSADVPGRSRIYAGGV